MTFFGYKAHAIHGIEVIKPAEIGLKKTREIASSELIFGEFRTFGTTVMLLNEAEIGGRRFIIFSTIDRSVLFSDSGRALPSVFTHQKLNFVYHYFFKAQLTFHSLREQQSSATRALPILLLQPLPEAV